MTSTRNPDLTWHQSLEQWCAEHLGHSRLSVEQQADFAPFEAHKPEKFYEVPVALMVLTSATRQLHRGFAEAVELIRASTSGFRAVLVTDLYQPPALEVCDWPAEQLLTEEAWAANKQGNWLAEAIEHLKSAQHAYGASYVIAPAGVESAAAALRHLVFVFNAPSAVLTQALEIFATAENDAEGPIGFRHGWQSVAVGESQRREFVSAEGQSIQVALHRGSGRGVVVDPAGQLPGELLDAAQRAGWSTAVFREQGEQGPTPAGFFSGLQRACADALKGGGPVLVCAGALHAGQPALACADSSEPLVDEAQGRIGSAGSAGRWSVELDQVAVVRFSRDQAPRAFSRLQSLNSTLLSR